jgi:hypothetical protein
MRTAIANTADRVGDLRWPAYISRGGSVADDHHICRTDLLRAGGGFICGDPPVADGKVRHQNNRTPAIRLASALRVIRRRSQRCDTSLRLGALGLFIAY